MASSCRSIASISGDGTMQPVERPKERRHLLGPPGDLGDRDGGDRRLGRRLLLRRGRGGEQRERQADQRPDGRAASHQIGSSGKMGRRTFLNSKRERFEDDSPGASTSRIAWAIGSKAAR